MLCNELLLKRKSSSLSIESPCLLRSKITPTGVCPVEIKLNEKKKASTKRMAVDRFGFKCSFMIMNWVVWHQK